MSITVAEKQHWKDRITKKIERTIKELVDANDPLFLQHISEKARKAAIASLGGTDHVEKLDSLLKQESDIQSQIEAIQEQLVKLATTHRVSPASQGYRYRSNRDLWDDAVQERLTGEEDKLLAADPLGQRILKLRREEEALLDTVWLSTSSVQIRQLWSNVMELLADEPSMLQRKLLLDANRPENKD